ncbi:MAG: TolC family protein, partial [Gemmataceae bacterium]|nr:TolC family protein [Gemmataceae bacterium]
FAQIDVWARQQQVEQGQQAYDRAEARKRQGFGNAAEVAQTKVSLSNFKANLIGSQANLLQAENALRNILGLRPTDFPRLELTTPPNTTPFQADWHELLRLAEERRPDLIELKLIVEADRQNVILANNNALPQVDATLLYRWNGLEGRTPTGAYLESRPGQFTDWTVGVNFSVPLGLRQGRAALRQAELLLKRDEANLEQGLHAATHTLAAKLRNLAQFYEQYLAFKETRTAARENLEQQLAEFKAGRAIYLNVLQAISIWGDAVSSEARALTQYNTELADLEKETGTILDTHGIKFYEERFAAIGPLGRLAHPRLYPAALPPGPNVDRYPAGTGPAQREFEKDRPVLQK